MKTLNFVSTFFLRVNGPCSRAPGKLIHIYTFLDALLSIRENVKRVLSWFCPLYVTIIYIEDKFLFP